LLTHYIYKLLNILKSKQLSRLIISNVFIHVVDVVQFDRVKTELEESFTEMEELKRMGEFKVIIFSH